MHTFFLFIFYHCATIPSGPGPPHDRYQAHRNRYVSSGRVISPTQRPLLHNTHHSQETGFNVPLAIFEPAIPVRERPQTHAFCILYNLLLSHVPIVQST